MWWDWSDWIAAPVTRFEARRPKTLVLSAVDRMKVCRLGWWWRDHRHFEDVQVWCCSRRWGERETTKMDRRRRDWGNLCTGRENHAGNWALELGTARRRLDRCGEKGDLGWCSRGTGLQEFQQRCGTSCISSLVFDKSFLLSKKMSKSVEGKCRGKASEWVASLLISLDAMVVRCLSPSDGLNGLRHTRHARKG